MKVKKSLSLSVNKTLGQFSKKDLNESAEIDNTP